MALVVNLLKTKLLINRTELPTVLGEVIVMALTMGSLLLLITGRFLLLNPRCLLQWAKLGTLIFVPGLRFPIRMFPLCLWHVALTPLPKCELAKPAQVLFAPYLYGPIPRNLDRKMSWPNLHPTIVKVSEGPRKWPRVLVNCKQITGS